MNWGAYNLFISSVLQNTCGPLAAYEGHSEIAKIILDVAVEKNPKDSRGSTPLHKAVSKRHVNSRGAGQRNHLDLSNKIGIPGECCQRSSHNVDNINHDDSG